MKMVMSREALEKMAEKIYDDNATIVAGRLNEHFERDFMEQVIDALGLSPYPQSSVCEDDCGDKCAECKRDVPPLHLVVYLDSYMAKFGIGVPVCWFNCADKQLRRNDGFQII